MRNKMSLCILILIGFAFCAMCSCFSYVYGQETFKPQVEYIEVPVVHSVNHYIVEEKEVIVEQEVIVEKEVVVEKEVIVEKPVELREFASLKELKEWLRSDNTDRVHLIFGNEGTRVNPDFDCDDYAYTLQKAAEKDGYLISIQVDTMKRHGLNNTFIGNDIYFIEPQTDKVWLAYYRD